MKRPFEVLNFASPGDLAFAAAQEWRREVESARRAGRTHCVALSGGRIAHAFFQAVTVMEKNHPTEWGHVHFFWADERCVPPDDEESNFRTALELLLRPLQIASNQIHRIHGEDDPETASEQAEMELRGIVSPGGNDRPTLDLVFLGLGEDGHVASLFPVKSEGSIQSEAVYLPVFESPKPPPTRITLSYRAIAAARKVWTLASGTGKQAALKSSLVPDGQTPFARLLKMRDWTKIFTDIVVE